MNLVNNIKSNLDPPLEKLQLIIRFYKKKQLTKVLTLSNQLIKEFPQSIILLNFIGICYTKMESFKDALESYKAIVIINPEDSDGHFNLANFYKDTGDLDAAITSYQRVLEINPTDAEACTNLGLCWDNKSEFTKAFKSYQQAIIYDPFCAVAHNNIGASFEKQGDFDKAIAQYTEAIRVSPNYAEAYNNIGNVFKDQGKLTEALEIYKKAIEIKPDYAESYRNLGITLQDQGKLEQAIMAYQKAIDINPQYTDAYNNLGGTFQTQGKLDEALRTYNKAVAISPNYTEAYYNIGITLSDQGKLEEAIKAYRRALSIRPNYADAYNSMGITLLKQGKLEEAIGAYSRALSINPNCAEAFINIGNALNQVVFKKPNPSMQKIIISILNHKTYVRPRQIINCSISLLNFEPSLQKLFQTYSLGELRHSVSLVVSGLSKVPLLLKLMSVCPLADLELEVCFTEIRATLLFSIFELDSSLEVLRFQSALALQCFTNEYIYLQSDSECQALEKLEASVKKTLLNREQPSAQFILCLSAYKVLHDYEWCDKLNVTNDIIEVFARQVLEPKKEAVLKIGIPVLQDIKDRVSFKVRNQYEANPYPRWVSLALSLNSAPISKMINDIKLKLFDFKINEVEFPNILIAGCGTGQHSIATAAQIKDSKVLAVDLSLSSLAYAQRKTEEIGLKNIVYMQADILDLGRLDRQFDIIESVGVLHHMHYPMAGWRVLTDCLKKGGLMKIGLYSELARKHITEIREEINQLGIETSDYSMKVFRSDLINSDKEHHIDIQSFSDFHSLSELRDLLFHEQEHRFTIPQLQYCLADLGLKFCGFEVKSIVQNFMLTNTGLDDPYDLEKWHEYEKTNPRAFNGMYQFWCQKIF